ncbi:hypothetical protein E2562_026238 [Oryza meyeriana var. granulata]|uniref:Uncharacterized protein n=1 Tax=Oryza meyeriana var. granulata TaxID=110450 RepID=A0A6G1CIL6_9ORYZ|nr:hypothetical protein E2562_026238 [Oryza meyeriana var. granulata]
MEGAAKRGRSSSGRQVARSYTQTIAAVGTEFASRSRLMVLNAGSIAGNPSFVVAPPGYRRLKVT